MEYVIRVVVFLVSIAASVHAFAQTQAQRKLPRLVQKDFAGMIQSCKEAGGKPSKSPGVLIIADLTGDGLPDFVIDPHAFICDGAASLFVSGHGSAESTVYVGTPDGQAFEAFTQANSGVKVDRQTKPAQLLFMVGGPLRGQKVKPDTPFAAFKSCWRPAVWRERHRKFELAPLSQIRPVE